MDPILQRVFDEMKLHVSPSCNGALRESSARPEVLAHLRALGEEILKQLGNRVNLLPLKMNRFFEVVGKPKEERLEKHLSPEQVCEELVSALVSIRNNEMNGPFIKEAIPADIIEWAQEGIDDEEIMAGIREIEETGGLQLEDFIEELEELVRKKD